MVSDLPRIGAWSPECESVEWEGDVTVPVEGTTFMGHNAVGPGRRIRYSRHGRVLVADPGREFAFVTDEGGRESTVWRYRFEPQGDGSTRVTEGYEVRWIPTWARILDVPTNRHKELLKGMRTTLERLKRRPKPSTEAHQFPARRTTRPDHDHLLHGHARRRRDHHDRRHPRPRLARHQRLRAARQRARPRRHRHRRRQRRVHVRAASVIDPGELRWIWLTHTDFDHIGSLATLLDANPTCG